MRAVFTETSSRKRPSRINTGPANNDKYEHDQRLQKIQHVHHMIGTSGPIRFSVARDIKHVMINLSVWSPF